MRWILLALAIMAAPAGFAAEPESIGQIKTQAGEASIARADKVLAAKAGDLVYLNDTLATEGAASLGVTLNDGTTLSLGSASRMTLDDFVYDPAHDKAGMGIRFLKGTLAYVSGRIAAVAPQNVAVRTPVASIGIRGTRFVVRVEGD